MPSRTDLGIPALARSLASRRALLAGAAAFSVGLAPATIPAAKGKGKGKRKKPCTIHDGAELAAAIAGAADGATLRLCAGTFSGSFTVAKPLTILGAGADRTLVVNGGSSSDHVFAFTGGAGATLSGLTISGNGRCGVYTDVPLTVSNCVVRDGVCQSGGGGIRVDPSGRLTLTDSKVFGNGAEFGGGILNNGTVVAKRSTIGGTGPGTANSALDGGGIANNGTLTLTGCHVLGNSAADGGGGVYMGGQVTLDGTTVAGNTALGNGGGVYNDGGTLVVRNGSVIGGTTPGTGNRATQGGGLFAATGPATFAKGAKVTGNVAAALGDGGGIYRTSNETVSLPRGKVVFANTPDNCGGVAIANCVN